MDFSKTVNHINDNLKITVSGYLNEFAELGEYDFTKIKNLLIDFSQLTMLNSRGVMIWLDWFDNARSKNSELSITFEGCPTFLVDNFNSVPILPAGTRVKSFAAPMYCAKCSRSVTIMLFEDKDYSMNSTTKRYEIPTLHQKCAKCGSNMEPDFNPNRYFNFLNSNFI